MGVRGIYPVSAEFVAAQIDAVAEDIGIDAAKTGMLASRAIVEVVADRVKRYAIRPLVVDPVMAAKSGDALLETDARAVLRDMLLPLATVVTPNLAEAQELTGIQVRHRAAMSEAARRVHELGPEWVLIKGGHLEGDPIDVLFDGRDVHEVRRPRVRTTSTHGTGCSYASAIATGLAYGMAVQEAVEWARDAVQAGLESALRLGHGAGPLDHAAMFRMGRRG
jgi:hydroxymethylpyrimidine/phosphomethylpyrimidine kinase